MRKAQLIELLTNYIDREFGADYTPEDVLKMARQKNGLVPMGSALTEDLKHDCETYFDIKQLAWVNYIDGVEKFREPRHKFTDNELINELESIDYYDVISNCVYYAESEAE